MLEAAMFGGIPEGSDYHFPYAPHQLLQDGLDRAVGSYPRIIPHYSFWVLRGEMGGAQRWIWSQRPIRNVKKSYLIFSNNTTLTTRYPFVCMSVGLPTERVPTVGVVYNPIIDELLTICGKSAFLIGKPIKSCLLVRESFFHNEPRNFVDLGGGVVGCRGFHLSFRATPGGLSLNMGDLFTLYFYLFFCKTVDCSYPYI